MASGPRDPRNQPTKDVARARHEARRWFVSGRVQGVGFRWFVENNAHRIGLRGWVRNEDDGRLQVYAVGDPDQLNQLAALLHQGPRMAEVRGVEEQEAAVQQLGSFHSE
jgi:acylphosphatase